MDKWLKYLVGISAIVIAGCAAFFSITGLGILFAGASISVMVMAGSLEYAKLVTATYLKQKWNDIKGFNKWYLTGAVIILMAITSAGIFGYLSNAFQQQNIKLDQVAREIQVWQNKIEYGNQQIATLQSQSKDLTSTQNTLITKGNVNNRLLKSVDNRDKQSTAISKKINILQDSIVAYNGHINDIKNNNIEIEREVGGFRFVAEAFGMTLNNVVKFFIFLIVIVFDPLAIALVIAFNQLILDTKKDEVVADEEDKTKEIIEEESRLKLSEEDLKILEEALLNPPPPNEKLKEAAQRYSDEVREKHTHIDDFEETLVKPQLTQEERHELLVEMMKNDQELGLYDEPYDNPMIKDDDSYDVDNGEDQLNEWDVTLMDGLEDEEPFFTEEETEKILQEEPTEEEIQRNFSTIEPETENIFQEEDMEVVEDFGISEDNERMDIIGQNGNEGLHYDNEENTSSEQDDEKKKLIEFQMPILELEVELGTSIIENTSPQETILESTDSNNENLYWETEDVNPNIVIYDLENNQTIVPQSEEEIIIPTAPVEKVISRNVSTRRRNNR